MYARITTLSMGPGTRALAERMADGLAKRHKNTPGLKSITFIANWDTGEYGSFQVWESVAAADAALPAIRATLEELAEGKIKGMPHRSTYEFTSQHRNRVVCQRHFRCCSFHQLAERLGPDARLVRHAGLAQAVEIARHILRPAHRHERLEFRHRGTRLRREELTDSLARFVHAAQQAERRHLAA